MVQKAYVSWRAFSDTVYLLAKEIDEEYDEEIESVVGIARGGLPGATAISHLLDADLEVVQATHYDGTEREDEVQIGKMTGASAPVVIFDDIVDSGKTMQTVKSLVEGRLPPESKVITATPIVKPSRRFEPDHWKEETDRWAVFPWEGDL